MQEYFENTWGAPANGALQTSRAEYFIRTRINALLTEAAKKPLILICAGMGYGKTIAVSDFVRECEIPTLWLQLNEFDNVGQSFWDSFTRAVEQISKTLAEECRDLSFPDTEDKVSQYILQRDRLMANQRYITVFDDVHLLENPAVIGFIEHIVYNSPENRTTILICREPSKINLSGLLVRGLVSMINESELNFTESELAQYLLQQGLPSEIPNLPEIYTDTKGWAFIVNFIVRILKKTPGYTGYARAFIKQSLFKMMEREAWNLLSERLQRFLVRLSLVNRLSINLVTILAEGDESLLMELNNQRAVYLRFDSFSGCYVIHSVFLDYLRSKQEILSQEEIYKTYNATAEWCISNGFSIDALSYYEKTGDYGSMVAIIEDSPTHLLLSVAEHLKRIFDRAPEEIFDRVALSPCAHVHILILGGQYQEALESLEYYERKFLALPDEDESRSLTLGTLYYYWGILRQLMCTVDDVYDFDVYFEKMSNYPTALPIGQIRENFPAGPYLNRAGHSRPGAPQEYAEAIARSVKYASAGTNAWMAGQEDLGRGELLFYQGDVHTSKPLIKRALEQAEKNSQFITTSVTLLYNMRIAVYQGDYEKAEQALKRIETQLEENEYDNRFTVYDLALGLYYYMLRLPEKIPNWLRGKFTTFFSANIIERLINQAKERYFYLTKQYDVLLTYMEERKRHETMLFSRVEKLAMEACARYQTKDKDGAIKALKEAYETALPNDIVMPFIEMGKDMRTLTLAALREENCGIPEAWLKGMNQKSSVYAKHQALLVSEYKKANNINMRIGLTHRETEVLRDLYKGMSRSEIASRQELSVNTVRLIINTIYDKLNARNINDLIRIAHEQKLI